MTSELKEIILRVRGALDAGETDHQRPHLEWELREMLKRIKAHDLTISEVLALIAVLRPVHAKILDKVVGGKPFLRIVPDIEKPPEAGKSVG
jgi:hypothetical protein